MKLLKNVMVISLAIIIGLPLFYFMIICPAFYRLQMREIENEAIRVARHLRNMVISGNAGLGRDNLMVSDALNREISLVKRDFKLDKVRIYSGAGEIIFSTDLKEADLEQPDDDFFNLVAKGRVFTREVHSQARTLKNRIGAANVLEAYVPLMRGGQFIGAFGISYDITDNREQLNGFIRKSFLYVFAFAGGLFILNIVLALNANKTNAAQRRAEEALQESEHKNRLVVENATQSIVVAQDAQIKFLNRKARDLTGYSDEELLSRPFIDFVHPADRETVIQRHRRRMEGREVSNLYQMRIIDKHGHEKWTEVNTILIDWEGRPAVLSFIDDVTARKRAEDALRENEEYLRAIMKTIQTGVLIVDPKTRKIVDANPHAAAMFGGEVYELLGRDYHAHMCMQAMGLCPQPEPCSKAEGADCVLRTADGNAIQVRRSAAAAKIKGHDYVVQSLQDITDIKTLLRKQEINMELAKNILGVVNTPPPRYTELSHDLSLFVDVIFLPCYVTGGDHYLVRSLASGKPNGRPTF